MAHSLFEHPVRRAHRQVIFDTAQTPALACLYGDDMRLEARAFGPGGRFLVLCGPEGEIELEQTLWRHVVAAMGLAAPGSP